MDFYFSPLCEYKVITKLLIKQNYIYTDWHIGNIITVFANVPGGFGSMPGRVIPKTKKKMVLDISLLNYYHKLRIKDK